MQSVFDGIYEIEEKNNDSDSDSNNNSGSGSVYFMIM